MVSFHSSANLYQEMILVSVYQIVCLSYDCPLADIPSWEPQCVVSSIMPPGNKQQVSIISPYVRIYYYIDLIIIPKSHFLRRHGWIHRVIYTYTLDSLTLQ